jgi:hypothetical protein
MGLNVGGVIGNYPKLSYGMASMPSQIFPMTQPELSFNQPVTAGDFAKYSNIPYSSPENVEKALEPSKFSWGLTNADGSLNWGGIGSIAKTVGGLGQVWAAIQANNIAKDTLAFQKKSYEKNMANQLAAYNLAIEDRGYTRAAQNNQSTATAEAFINKNRLA